MKKILFLSLFSLITLIGIAQNLREDNDFIDLINLKTEFTNQVLKNFNGDLNSFSEFKSSMERMSNDASVTDEAKVAYFNEKIIFSEGKNLTYFADAFKEKWSILSNRYGGSLTSEYLTEEISFLLNDPNSRTNHGVILVGGGFAGGGGCERPRMFAACTAAAYAAAILCHGACVGTYFGFFACVALCGTIESWAIIVCYDTYCKPGAIH